MKAHASPTKEFFVYMITKDISLAACILDLLDNCVDGARDDLRRLGAAPPEEHLFRGYGAEITFDEHHFQITDNCGGIPVDDAINYAFHFGRRPDAPDEAEHAIGHYGIGMKRAVFKIGRLISVRSSTREEAFSVDVNVDEWLRQRKQIIELDDEPPPSDAEGEHHAEERVVWVDDWDFSLEVIARWDPAGTTVRVENPYDGIAAEFDDARFADQLITDIGRDYAFILQKGFQITVNGHQVLAYDVQFRESDQIAPVNLRYEDRGVEVRVIAGMAAPPQDDITPEAEPTYDPKYSGWYVLCNDRVVLAADKTDRTGWGTQGLPRWHYQYNGFVGIVSFYSTTPQLLPWDTTKRNLEVSDPRYRRAVAKMRLVTRPFTDYTNTRKGALVEARVIETRATPISVTRVREAPIREMMMLPELPVAPKERLAVITYRKPHDEVEAVKEALNEPGLTQAEVGIRTFDYFRDKFARG
jgi:hypothetical protein